MIYPLTPELTALLIAAAVVLFLLVAFVCLVVYAHLPFRAIEILEQENVPDHIKAVGKKQFWK
jgi:hypothetical protein